MQIPFFTAVEAKTIKWRKAYWYLPENIIFNMPSKVYPAAEHSITSSASMNSNLTFTPCLTKEAEQDHSILANACREL